MNPWHRQLALPVSAAFALFILSQAIVFSTSPASLEKQNLLEDINAVLSDTWFQRWFVTDAVASATIGNERFREAARRSVKIEAAARAVIGDPEIDTEKKVMAIHMMQCLPPDRYVAFVRFVLGEAQASHCPRALVADALYPGAHWGSGISLQYQEPRVQDLLKEIEDASLGDERVRDRVSSIRDGSYAEYVKHLRETGNRVPPVQCEQ